MKYFWEIVLCVLVVAACLYFVFNSPWFEIGDACPEGQQRMLIVLNEGQVDERVDTMCVRGGG